jgi:hypothetical protein
VKQTANAWLNNILIKLQALKENIAGLCRDLHPCSASGSAGGGTDAVKGNSNSASKRDNIGLPLNAPVKVCKFYKNEGRYSDSRILRDRRCEPFSLGFVCLQRVLLEPKDPL